MDKKIIINNSVQVEKAFNAVRVNEYEAYDIPAVQFNAGGVPVVQSLRVEANFFTQFVDDFCTQELLPNVKGDNDLVTRAFMGQLYLQVANVAVLHRYIIQKIVKDDKARLVHTNFYGLKVGKLWDFCMLVNYKGEDKLVSIVSGKFYKKEALKNCNYWLYDFVGKSSAGELKKNGVMMYGKYIHNIAVEKTPYEGYDRDEAIAKSNCGMWRIHEQFDTDSSAPKIAKFMMRVAQDMAKASTATEKLPIPAVLIETTKGKIEDRLEGTGKFSAWDGMMFGSARYLTQVFNTCQDTYKVLEEACVGAFAQARPWSVTKGMILFLEMALLRNMVERVIAAADGLVVINAETASEELRNEVWVYMHTGAAESVFAGKAMLIVWPSILEQMKDWETFEYEGTELPLPALVTDFNGLKTGFDIQYKSGLRILNNAHKSHKMGKMSVQLVQSVVANDFARGSEFLVRLGKHMVDHKLAKFDADGTILNDEGEIIDTNAEVFNGSIDYRALVNRIAPEFSRHYYVGSRKDLEMAAEGLMNKISASNYDLGSKAEILMADPMAIFSGVQVLNLREVEVKFKGETVTAKAFEVYSRDLKAGEVRILNRFPKAGRGEFLVVVGVSPEEYLEKAIGAGVNENLAADVIKMVSNLTHGIIIIPANPIALKLTGGADFDGDKGMLYVTDKKDMRELQDEFTFLMASVENIVVDKD